MGLPPALTSSVASAASPTAAASAASAAAASASTTSSPTSSTAGTASASTSPAAGASAGSSSGAGQLYKATFTEYSGCGSNAACAFTTNPGYSAAISQFLYGGTSGTGPGCGLCWNLTAEHDSSGNTIGKSMVVMINNECPAQGNPLCAQSGGSVNAQGGEVNFDLCSDSGSAQVFFPNGGGIGIGSAVQVDCGEWQGSVQKVG